MNKNFLLVVEKLESEIVTISESLRKDGHRVDIKNDIDSILASFKKEYTILH